MSLIDGMGACDFCSLAGRWPRMEPCFDLIMLMATFSWSFFDSVRDNLEMLSIRADASLLPFFSALSYHSSALSRLTGVFMPISWKYPMANSAVARPAAAARCAYWYANSSFLLNSPSCPQRNHLLIAISASGSPCLDASAL